jgi:S-methylmethionine-dependent homocysteine/selenocysteine methylase
MALFLPRDRRGCTAMRGHLSDGGVVVIDGGMGSELEARGAPMDHEAWCGLANLDAPGLVREIHEDYIRAGADVIIANTFPSNRVAMEAAGHGDHTEAMNRAAVAAALEARDRAAAGRPVAVAGSMSIWGPYEEAPREDAPPAALVRDVYGEQAAILADAGVDLLVLEMLDVRWAAAVGAALETGLPVWAGIWAHLDADGRPVTPQAGTPLEDDLPTLLDGGDGLEAVLVMHSAVGATLPALDVVARHWNGPRGAYPHAGHFERPNWVFEDIAPEDLAAEAGRWLDQGATLVGGCCGTGPAHIAAIRRLVDGRSTTRAPLT